MYAMDPDYVFVAQRHSEMHALEMQINMSMSHGSLEVKETDGTTLVPSNDHFNIFQSIEFFDRYETNEQAMQTEINENRCKALRTNGNKLKPMEINEKRMGTNSNQ